MGRPAAAQRGKIQQELPIKSGKNYFSPGPDSIYYSFLEHLPCTHHFLATLLLKLFHLPLPQPAGLSQTSVSKMNPGPSSDPTNFMMFVLSLLLLVKLSISLE